MASKSLLCRLGIHKWQTHHNDEGQKYITCLRCKKESDQPEMGKGPPPPM
jgi:hypothetical protein